MTKEYTGFEEVLASIAQADFQISEARLQKQVEIVIFGGSAFIYRDKKGFRPTRDIDAVIHLEGDRRDLDEQERKVMEILENNNIFGNIESILDLPPYEEYKDRWEEIELELEWIKVYVASKIDLIMSKVFSTRPKDYTDLVNSDLIDSIDHDYLIETYEDYKGYSNDPHGRNHNLYDIIVERNEKEKGV